MKVTYNTGKMSVELEGETQRDLFGQLAAFQEVFDETTCGKCGSTNVEFAVRRRVEVCSPSVRMPMGIGFLITVGSSGIEKLEKKYSYSLSSICHPV